MNKLGYWIVGVLIVAIVAALIFGFNFFSNLNTGTPANTNGITGGTLPSTPAPGGGQTLSGDTITLSTADGKSIQVKDFKKDPSVVKDPANPGYYYFGYHYNEGYQDATATDTPPYIIQYNDSNQFFTIALLEEPIGQTRLDAQQYLIQHLGITEPQMCLLKYMVSVPTRVNATYAGTDLRFSFCDGETGLQ